MDGLEHGVPLADVGAARRSDAALYLGGLVGQDVAVEVGERDDPELLAAVRVDELGGHDVDEPVVPLYPRVVLGHLGRDAEELAVGGLDHVGLGHDADLVYPVLAGVLERQPNEALRPLVGGDAEVDGQIVGDMHPAAAEDVAALGVLPEEHPVHAQLWHPHRADVGEEVQFPPHRDVGALDVGPRVPLLGSGGRPLQNDVAFLQLGEDVIGDRLHGLDPVLNGQPLDVPELHLAALQLVGEQRFQHVPR